MKLINIVENIFREEDTTADAELEQHIDKLFSEILNNVSELQDIYGSTPDHILKLVQGRIKKSKAPKPTGKLPF